MSVVGLFEKYIRKTPQMIFVHQLKFMQRNGCFLMFLCLLHKELTYNFFLAMGVSAIIYLQQQTPMDLKENIKVFI
jgi:hypothetical protein